MSDWKVIRNDALEALKKEKDNSFDAFFADTPYGIHFMCSAWDHDTGPSFDPVFWKEVYRVLKPGAPLLAFGGTRTYHRQTCAIEDAGFEIRDCLMWLYGSGFPKSHDISKGIDASRGGEKFDEIRTYLKEVMKQEHKTTKEVSAFMGVSNTMVAQHWLSASQPAIPTPAQWEKLKGLLPIDDRFNDLLVAAEREKTGQTKRVPDAKKCQPMFAGLTGNSEMKEVDITIPAREQAKTWEGYGTALKPAWEPCVLAMKPCEGTFAGNALSHGVAGLNLKDCRVGNESIQINQLEEWSGFGQVKEPDYKATTSEGRWPANLLLECICESPEYKDDPVCTHAQTSKEKIGRPLQSKNGIYGTYKAMATSSERPCTSIVHTNPECPGYKLDHQSGNRPGGQFPSMRGQSFFTAFQGDKPIEARAMGDSGGASRFFYCAKASSFERNAGCERFGIKPEWSKLEVLEVEYKWEKEDRKVRLLVDTEPSVPKVIDASITKGKTEGWSTMLSGKLITDLFPKGSMSITSTKTNSTTTSRTLNYLHQWITSGSTQEHSCQTAGKSAPSAKNQKKYQSFILKRIDQDQAQNVGSVLLPEQFKVSATGEKQLSNVVHCSHPCLKPISLTTYLAKLLLPPKQEGKTRRLLVPFSGVGSEMIGALLAGWDEVVGIEKCARYVKISKARIKWWIKHPEALVDKKPGSSQGHWPDVKTTGYGEFGGGKSVYKGPGRKEKKSPAKKEEKQTQKPLFEIDEDKDEV